MPTFKQALQLLGLLPRAGAVRAILKWKPFSITSFRMLSTLRSQGLRPATVIDAGANVGQFARAAAEIFPEAQIISFEALPEAATQLRANVADCANVTVIESAVGNSDDTIRFFQYADSLASSALPLEGKQSAHRKELEVPIGRLDTMLDPDAIREPVLLKLDVQGYELEALRGASHTLSIVQYVLLEIGFESAYVGNPSFDEIYDLLREAGFYFRRPVDVLTNEHGAIYVMDALFEREQA